MKKLLLSSVLIFSLILFAFCVMNIKSVLAQEFNPNDTYQTTKVPGEGSTTNPPATNRAAFA